MITATPWDLEQIVDEEPIEGQLEREELLPELHPVELEEQYRFDPARAEIEESIERCREVPLENPGRDYFLSPEKLEVTQAIEKLQDAPDDSLEQGGFLNLWW
jgi:hypothetical protein